MPETQDKTAGNGKAVDKTDNKKPQGRVAVMEERCKGCAYCVEFCPAGVLIMSADFNLKGYHFPEVADAAKCNGCALCGMFCPDFAITGYFFASFLKEDFICCFVADLSMPKIS